MKLTEKMEQAGFEAIEEYERWKSERKFPRPSLIAHIWDRMTAASRASKPSHTDPGARLAAIKDDTCPECSGELDTGWECNACGFDAKPEHDRLVSFLDRGRR